MRLFYSHPWIDIYTKRNKKITIQSISFSDVKHCALCLHIDLETFVICSTYGVCESLIHTRNGNKCFKGQVS